ncbi:DMT family transporter [Cryobacterium sp. CG_9.6]|uniref:DMT family transporter n=1 Tax=Cryobacterium sp. CG_9.6 TaxID=2760710 RepID=UPI0024764F4F|nr:DMT family transporter [Cryobacterium sp. CG_9.6]MDH6237849.1 transporter family-2 protein [Cryobacterium sp. CG_9.6]
MTELRAQPVPGDPVSATRSVLPVWLAVIFSVLIGSLYALQSRVNGELGVQIGDGFAAAVISFGSGLVILCVGLLLWPTGRRGLTRVREAVRSGSLSWWHLCGGVSGAFFVLSQGLAASMLGIALFTVAVVAGQTVSGLLMDRFGIGPGGRRPLTATKIVGVVVALVAVLWTVSGQLTSDVPLWLLWLPLVAGVGQGWQQAVNGRVRILANSALTATFLNFATGTIALVIAAVVHGLSAGFPTSLPTAPWLYLGGVIGCIFIAGAAVVVRTTGVLLLGLSIVAGQLLCALAIDVIAPTSGHPLTLTTVGGSALALAAVVIVGFRWRLLGRRRRG